ncbi:hypothetical protein BOX15_Mlig000324g1, partial [Macrostomum lignano]
QQQPQVNYISSSSSRRRSRSYRVLLSQSRPRVDEAEKCQAAVDLMVGRVRGILDDMNRAEKQRERAAREAAIEERTAFLLNNYGRLKRIAECNTRRRLFEEVEQQRRLKAEGGGCPTPSPTPSQRSTPPPPPPTPPPASPSPQSAFEARRRAVRRRLKASREARAAAAAEAARLASTGDDGRAEAVMEKLLYEDCSGRVRVGGFY